MQLPSALEQTTLGDVLGTLYRGRGFGVLEVATPSGRVHEIELRDGCVSKVNVDSGAAPRLGEVLCARLGGPQLPGAVWRALQRVSDERPLGQRLVAAGVVTRQELDATLCELYRARLDAIERLPRATLRFRPLRWGSEVEMQLSPEQFLHGRARRRRAEVTSARAASALDQDYALFGLRPGASAAEVKRAFRAAARYHHPDRSVHLGPRAVARAEVHFRQLVQSYERLCRYGETRVAA